MVQSIEQLARWPDSGITSSPVTAAVCPFRVRRCVPLRKTFPESLGPGTVSHIRMSQSSDPENRKLASSAMLITASRWPMCSPSSWNVELLHTLTMLSVPAVRMTFFMGSYSRARTSQPLCASHLAIMCGRMSPSFRTSQMATVPSKLQLMSRSARWLPPMSIWQTPRQETVLVCRFMLSVELLSRFHTRTCPSSWPVAMRPNASKIVREAISDSSSSRTRMHDMSYGSHRRSVLSRPALKTLKSSCRPFVPPLTAYSEITVSVWPPGTTAYSMSWLMFQTSIRSLRTMVYKVVLGYATMPRMGSSATCLMQMMSPFSKEKMERCPPASTRMIWLCLES
mmetsp:Transcript_22672/g.62960  ORF Transcript_22672/g.62960 Transcript_22672/m.62960 type:complete len:339 (-) Transcript_22672:642-1658(-)